MNPYFFDVKLISKNKIHTVNLLPSFLWTPSNKTHVAIDIIFHRINIYLPILSLVRYSDFNLRRTSRI